MTMKIDKNNPKNRLVLALDVNKKEDALALVRELKDYIGIFKIGLQLFTSYGPQIVQEIQSEGCKIFFDAKFHDIPNTVAKASDNIAKLGVDIFDIHVTGGSKMIKAAVKTAKNTAQKNDLEPPVMLGITILSSLDQAFLNEELQIKYQIDDYVLKLATLAKNNGLDGVVASVREAAKIKETLGDSFVILCPGIRPAWADVNDQSRIATPAEAIKQGADFMVVGRPITQAENRVEAAKKILDEISSVI